MVIPVSINRINALEKYLFINELIFYLYFHLCMNIYDMKTYKFHTIHFLFKFNLIMLFNTKQRQYRNNYYCMNIIFFYSPLSHSTNFLLFYL